MNYIEQPNAAGKHKNKVAFYAAHGKRFPLSFCEIWIHHDTMAPYNEKPPTKFKLIKLQKYAQNIFANFQFSFHIFAGGLSTQHFGRIRMRLIMIRLDCLKT